MLSWETSLNDCMQSIQLKACRGAWPFPPFTMHEGSRYPTLPFYSSPTESLFSESMSEWGKKGMAQQHAQRRRHKNYGHILVPCVCVYDDNASKKDECKHCKWQKYQKEVPWCCDEFSTRSKILNIPRTETVRLPLESLDYALFNNGRCNVRKC